MGRINNSIASMIRGKSVEEAIRFAFFNHKDKFSIKAAQNYANDLYYLRTKAAADAIKFTIVKDEKSMDSEEEKQAAIQCSIDNQDDCEMCGS